MTIDCPIRAALARIAPHLETLDPLDREQLRPAVRAFENDVQAIPVPERVVAIIRKVDARLPNSGLIEWNRRAAVASQSAGEARNEQKMQDVAQFEIGFVPSGWTRGERLHMVNGVFASGPWAAISRAMVYGCDSLVGPEAFYIRFHEDNKQKVAKWIEWWHATEAA